MKEDEYDLWGVTFLQAYGGFEVGDVINITSGVVVNGIFKILELRKQTTGASWKKAMLENNQVAEDSIIIARVKGPDGRIASFNAGHLITGCEHVSPLTALILFGKDK